MWFHFCDPNSFKKNCWRKKYFGGWSEQIPKTSPVEPLCLCKLLSDCSWCELNFENSHLHMAAVSDGFRLSILLLAYNHQKEVCLRHTLVDQQGKRGNYKWQETLWMTTTTQSAEGLSMWAEGQVEWEQQKLSLENLTWLALHNSWRRTMFEGIFGFPVSPPPVRPSQFIHYSWVLL